MELTYHPTIPAPDGIPLPEKTLWDKILVQYKPEVDYTFYNCYLRAADQISLTDEVLTLGVNDQHKREWLQDRASNRIRQLASGIAGRKLRVEIIYVGDMW